MKIFKILIVNLLIVIFCVFFLELYYINKWDKGHFRRYFNNIFHSISADKYFDMLYSGKRVKDASTAQFRPDIVTISDKLPLLFMGCSFTWGGGMDAKETFPATISKLTNRSVYNRAGCGWGLAQLLYQSKREEIYKIKEPEYIIYTFINDHVNRLDKFKTIPNVIDFTPKYRNKNGKLIEEKPKFYDRLYSVENYRYYYNYRYGKEKLEDIIFYFKETKNEIRKHWKKAKFIVLIYPTVGDSDDYINDLCTQLTDDDFKTIIIKDIVDVNLMESEYQLSPNDNHPSEKAWDIVSPAIVRELNL